MNCDTEQKVMITAWFLSENSYALAARKFHAFFGRNVSPPSERQTKRYAENLRNTGSIFLQRQGPQVTATGDHNTGIVTTLFNENPHMSTREASKELHVSQPSVVRILKASNYHPYKLRIVQELSEEDRSHRKVFAETELQLSQDDSESFNFFFSSDEANFYLNGAVNRHNFRYWSDNHPKWFREQPLNSPKLSVWGAIWKGGVVGPFFFEGNVNGVNYLQMLQDYLLPYLQAKNIVHKVRFQQDGAPPHWSREVRSFLDRTFPEGWIGRGSNSVPWPARSPDLSPCDFFLWGTIKDKVYKTKPRSLQELKEKIAHAFAEIDSDMVQKTLQNYAKRLEECVTINGDHVEL